MNAAPRDMPSITAYDEAVAAARRTYNEAVAAAGRAEDAAIAAAGGALRASSSDW